MSSEILYLTEVAFIERPVWTTSLYLTGMFPQLPQLVHFFTQLLQ